MSEKKKAQKKEKSAMSVSLYGNLVFVFIELFMSVYTSSQAVLLDAVYDTIEFFMLLPSVFIIPLLYKPANENHPFGFLQIESMFVVIKGVAMTGVTLGLIFNNIQIMIHGGRTISFDTVAYFEFSACILGILVYFYLKRKNKVMNSPMVEMEMQGWKIDSFASLGMSAAFFLPIILPFQPLKSLIPYLDQIITITLSLFMLPTPVHTVITGLRDLFLLPPEEETVDDIKDVVSTILHDNGYDNPLYYDILRTGRKLWISVYISFDKDLISIKKFKVVQSQCIHALQENYQDFYLELLPDIEFSE